MQRFISAVYQFFTPDVTSIWEGTNWDLAEWLRSGLKIFDYELPYKTDVFDSTNGLYVPEKETVLYYFGYGGDMVLCIVLAFFMFLFRILTTRFIWNPCALRCNIKKVLKRKKFAESASFFIFYAPMFIWGVRLLFRHKLAFPFSQLVAHYPQHLFTFELKLYLAIQVSYYLSSFVYLLFFDIKRKDFTVMVVHHLLTISLIFFSQRFNYRNYAIIILVLHDISDIFLFLSKLILYAQFTRLAHLMFVVFSLSFLAFRILFFPYLIYFGIVRQKIATESIWNHVAGFYYTEIGKFRVVCLLLGLFVLHVLWFSLILKMVCGFIQKGEIKKDIRSDDEQLNED